jgi:zinc-binding alcohol dehydrogenase family protein
MKAIGFYKSKPIVDSDSLVDIELPDPTPGGFDLLVEVKAISVNPVDVKVRASATPAEGQPRVLGWDAAGIVCAVGEKVTRFAPGDRVWYAGDLTRQGSNAQLQLVDEHLVGPMPKTLDFAQAAALPLTAITAWELLFDRLKLQHVDPTRGNTLLIIGAAGGVGSILIQLAHQLTGLTVIATASRPTTRAWVESMGAHHVIDHGQPWKSQLAHYGITHVSHVIGLNHTDAYIPQIVDVLEPEGQLAIIDDPESLDIRPFKSKSISVHWEFMFTRSMFKTDTMSRQHDLLRRIASLVDSGTIVSTLTQRIEGISAQTLRRAHQIIETGGSHGKVVLEGF